MTPPRVANTTAYFAEPNTVQSMMPTSSPGSTRHARAAFLRFFGVIAGPTSTPPNASSVSASRAASISGNELLLQERHAIGLAGDQARGELRDRARHRWPVRRDFRERRLGRLAAGVGARESDERRRDDDPAHRVGLGVAQDVGELVGVVELRVGGAE